MRTIHFKNGDTKTITDKELDYIISTYCHGDHNLKGLKDDGRRWYLIINMDEVLYID